MPHQRMSLHISVPSHVALEADGVRRVVAECRTGFFGILPRRLDCVVCLVAGVLIYETEDQIEHYVAVDEGILVKTGFDIEVSVRNATVAHELGTGKKVVTEEFETSKELDKKIRTSLAKLEGDFVRRLMEFRHHG